MDVYWFDVEVVGPVTGDHVEALGEALSVAGGIDATIQAGDQGGAVMFSREADDAVQAIVSAVDDLEAAGMTVAGVTEDRVVIDEIAQRAKVTAASVRYWIGGPVCTPGRRCRRGCPQRNSARSTMWLRRQHGRARSSMQPWSSGRGCESCRNTIGRWLPAWWPD